MEHTEFKGYTFSQLALGTVQLGMPYGISNPAGAPAPEESFRMLQYAAQAGINTFDTARQYGNAEEVLAHYLAGTTTPGHVVSKFKISVDNISHLERAWKEAQKSVQASLRALGIPKLPVCLLHKGAEPMKDLMRIIPEILRRLKEEGLVEIGGISAFFPEDVAYFLEEEAVQATQVPLNILDRRLIRNGHLQQLQQHEKLVFVRSVFLQGLFFMQAGQLKGNLEKAVPHLLNLQQLAQEAGMSVAQMAFSFVRDLPAVNSIVIGAVNRQQIEQNVERLNGPAIPENVLAKSAALFSEVEEAVLTPVMWK